jgi:hypothetical protein
VHNTEAIPVRNCIEAIRGHRDKNGDPSRREYLIRWKGKPSSDDTWVPMWLMADGQALIDDYERRLYGDLQGFKQPARKRAKLTD